MGTRKNSDAHPGYGKSSKAELEHSVQLRCSIRHHVVQWLVEYTAAVLSTYHVDDDGKTRCEHLHGQRADETLANFGETVFFFMPVRRRATLELKWSMGTDLGTLMSSNDSFIGLPNGDVTRARGIARIRPDQRWDGSRLQTITGVPGRPHDTDDVSILETLVRPHIYLDDDERAALDQEDGNPPDLQPELAANRKLPSLRITRADLNKHGYHVGCLRCTGIRLGDFLTGNTRSDECRRSRHAKMGRAREPKLLRWFKGRPGRTLQFDKTTDLEPTKTTDAESEPATPASSSSSAGPPGSKLVVVENRDVDSFTDVTALLVDHGVQPCDATRYVCAALRASNAGTFWELYGRGKLTDAYERNPGLNVKGLRVLDLRSHRPDAQTWDFDRSSYRKLARRLVEEDDPDWIIAAPQCTAFSMLNVGMNYPKMNEAAVKKK